MNYEEAVQKTEKELSNAHGHENMEVAAHNGIAYALLAVAAAIMALAGSDNR